MLKKNIPVIDGSTTKALRDLNEGETIAFPLHRERCVRSTITIEHRKKRVRYLSHVDSVNKLFYVTKVAVQ